MVGEEDLGHSLLFHRDSLINGFNYSEYSQHKFNLIFHAGETNWPVDIAPAQSGDNVATIDNLFDALLLNTRRIGHGLGIVKYPGLYKYLIEKQIAVEVCPTSNQILGYVADLRNHPAVNYYKSGVPIVIAGDDPGSFGYNELTVDYYMAYMAWGLDMYDLKTIANNSIRYSVLPEEKRAEGYTKFARAWDTFVDETYKSVCSSQTRTEAPSQLNATDLLPGYGPHDANIDIELYGYGFDFLLCRQITCLFDKIPSNGTLHRLGQIRCATPQVYPESNYTANLSLLVDGQTYIPTGLTYTFVVLDKVKQDCYKINLPFGLSVSFCP
jgi:adenosine deaminase CECR1